MLQLQRPVKEITVVTGYNKSTIGRIEKRAKACGYIPETNLCIILAYINNTPRAGRPKKVTQVIEDSIVSTITKNSITRSLTGQKLGLEFGLSVRTIQYTLKRRGFRKVKPTVKPGLTTVIIEARYQFALRYKDWTLEDWKAVIWSDETSIILGHRRGGQRVWRTSKEAHNPHVKRQR